MPWDWAWLIFCILYARSLFVNLDYCPRVYTVVLRFFSNVNSYSQVNSYAPNSRQIAFLNKLWKKINRVQQGRLLRCGDFNRIRDALADSTSKGARPPLQLGSWFTNLQLWCMALLPHIWKRLYFLFACPHINFQNRSFFGGPAVSAAGGQVWHRYHFVVRPRSNHTFVSHY